MKRTISWDKWVNNFVPNNEVDDEDGMPVQHPPFLHTPYGAITLKMFSPEKNNMNFWCGQTNFDLGEPECMVIDDTPGVEILDIFSSYRFRICIGSNFSPDKVKRMIGIRLGCIKLKIENKDSQREIKKLKIDLESSGKMWLIYALPNGKHEHFSTDDLKDFEDKLDKYSKAELSIGGRVIYGV